jgi:hypothetical protein
MVRVRVGVSQGPVVEGNCVVARRGGEQPETNWRSAGDELVSAGCVGEPAGRRRSLKLTKYADEADKAIFGASTWLEAERREVCAR